MSNRNFDNRVILQRLQEKNYARSLYSNNVYGQTLINNPQTSNGNSSKFNGFVLGSQSMYFKGLLGGVGTVDLGATTNIPPMSSITSSPAPIDLGPGSIYFNHMSSPNGSYISYQNDSNLSIGDNSFTIEWYQYWEEGANYPRVFSIGSYGSEHIDIAVSYELGEGETFIFWMNGNAKYIGSVPPKNEWVHMAIVGTKNVGIKFYQNGNQIHEIQESYNFSDAETSLTIGNESDPSQQASFTGKITNFRWIVGAALYTTPFSPPEVPVEDLLNINSNTKLLLLITSSLNLTKDIISNRNNIKIGIEHSSELPTAITTVPSAPIITSILIGNEQLTVNFTAPIYNGNSEITGYEYSIDDGEFVSFTPNNYSTIINNLVNGTTYNVKIRAVNSIGTGVSSNTILGRPVIVPDTPILITVYPDDTQLTVVFTPPIPKAGETITGYKYSINNGAFISSSTYTQSNGYISIPITGLINGTQYSIRIKSVNSFGEESISSNTLQGIPLAPVMIPGAPTITYGLASNGGAYIYFTAGSGVVDNYEYTSIDENSILANNAPSTALSPVDTVSPIYIPELGNNIFTPIRIRAVNSAGKSDWSSTYNVRPTDDTTIPDALLIFDPNDNNSYSGTGTAVKSIGTNNTLIGTKGTYVGYINETLSNDGGITTFSRNVFDFNGSNGNVITFQPFNFGTQISAIAWIYPRAKHTINGLLVNTTPNVATNGFKFQWNWWNSNPVGNPTNGRVMGMQAGNGSQGRDNTSVQNIIEYDTWQHVGYVFDQENKKIIFFKNGIPVDMATSIEPVDNIDTNRAFSIGGYNGGSYAMNAKLGYIKVFNELLNATQVLQDYNNTKSQFGL